MTRSTLFLFLSLFLIFLLALSVNAVDLGETYFKFQTPERRILDKISRLVSIDNVTADEVYAYANDVELALFQGLGIPFELLPHPGAETVPRMARTPTALAEWDAYPSYETYVAMMYQFQVDYPGLCRIVDAGATVQGRSILFAQISDNVSTEEDEPEVMHTSSMHGDETTGYILCLRLIDSLLSAYGSDPYITRLVDSLEIWINPSANPDGTYYSGNSSVYGARRYNANGVDINRNFPDPAEGDHPDGNSWQPETVVMMNLAQAHSFNISANFHGGAEVVNYPWDTWSRAHADEDWYVNICLAWAQSAQAASPGLYMESLQFPDGITNGYAWYRVAGGRQDYMIYWRGCREVTAEISNVKLLPPDELPDLWSYNKQAWLEYLENALYGVRGIVTDASTGLPVAATIRVLNHDVDSSRVFTDPDVGDYHRMLSEGTYTFEYSSLGYIPDTAYSVSVTAKHSTIRNVALEPLAGTPSLAVLDHDVQVARRGDAIGMLVTLVNEGDGNATGLSGVLTTSDPALTITQNFSSFPTIPGLGGSGQATTAYSLSVAADCPLNHSAFLTLFLTGSGGYSQDVPLNLVVEPVTEDFESGSFEDFDWQFTGNRGWSIAPFELGQGVYSARSGAITHTQTSRMSVTVEVAQAGKIWFDFKVSSESGGDYLRFYIDEIERGGWSGEHAWSTVSFNVDAGWHIFTWEYSKDDEYSFGQDRVWIDQVIFPALISHLQIANNSIPDWTVGQPYAVLLDAANQLGVASWSDKYDDLSGTGLVLSSSGFLGGTPGSIGTVQFTAGVEDAAGTPVDRLFSMSVHPPPQITTALLPDAKRGDPYQYQLLVDGGTLPLTWAETSGILSGTGLTVSPDGSLSGIPIVAGDLNLTVAVTDAAAAIASRELTLHISGGCCIGRVGDPNGQGEYPDEITLGDIMLLVDVKFISGDCSKLPCLTEADVNQDGGADPTCEEHVTLADIMTLVDFLFITGPENATLPECL
jgi:murein tripeptide amidase MpaA